MTIQELLDASDYILMEAAVIETLRRFSDLKLHPLIENALLVYEDRGKGTLFELYQSFIRVAHNVDVPICVCTPTWRANRERLSMAQITTDVNGDAVEFIKQVREKWGSWAANILIGGLLGCKNDCYKPDEGLSVKEAEDFHHWQITRIAKAGVDFLLAATLPALPEATGIGLAMAQTNTPYIISFVINKQGRILDGSTLENAFDAIDSICDRPPLGYMINCAYPSFLKAHQLPPSALSRIIGYQANASSRDPSQLDGAETLYADDISDWGNRMIELNQKFGVKILGGCCGTSCDHLRFIVENRQGG
jgi:homocysteine S-methyltransferase